MSNITSEYFSEDRIKHAMVFSRTFGGFRVVLIDSYFESQDEKMFDHQETAEEFAEDWVLNK